MQREQQAQQNHDAIMEAPGVSSSSSTRLRWRTPALYIFAGVAGMLGFIGVASVALVCLWWKMSSASTNAAAAAPIGYNNNRVTGSAAAAAAAEESSEKNEDTVVCCVGDAGPHKVLIIMPGQQQPTFIGSQLSHLTAAPSQ